MKGIYGADNGHQRHDKAEEYGITVDSAKCQLPVHEWDDAIGSRMQIDEEHIAEAQQRNQNDIDFSYSY